MTQRMVSYGVLADYTSALFSVAVRQIAIEHLFLMSFGQNWTETVMRVMS
jgi:hypothetical protein